MGHLSNTKGCHRKILGAYFACVLIEILTKLLVDPYYEPISQFMICIICVYAYAWNSYNQLITLHVQRHGTLIRVLVR